MKITKINTGNCGSICIDIIESDILLNTSRSEEKSQENISPESGKRLLLGPGYYNYLNPLIFFLITQTKATRSLLEVLTIECTAPCREYEKVLGSMLSAKPRVTLFVNEQKSSFPRRVGLKCEFICVGSVLIDDQEFEKAISFSSAALLLNI